MYKPFPRPYVVRPSQKELSICLSFFAVNRMVHAELMDILYGENKFVFEIRRVLANYNWNGNTIGQYWRESSFTLSFGGEVSAARWMKQCEILLSYALILRRKEILGMKQTFVTFAKAFEGENRLRFLKVIVKQPPRINTMSILEPLAMMRGVERVEIDTGDAAFSRRLASVMMGGKERELKVLEYGELTYKRRRAKKNSKIEVKRSLKTFADPEFDWSWDMEDSKADMRSKSRNDFGEGSSNAAAEAFDQDIRFGKFIPIIMLPLFN
jgi:hypothetical protein